MPKLYVARRAPRKALYLPMEQNSRNPSLIFPLMRSTDPSELDEQIRAQLEKVGVTKESDVQAVLDKAEADYEYRIKVDEARKEIRRLLALRGEGKKLMSVGHKKWKEVNYRPVNRK